MAPSFSTDHREFGNQNAYSGFFSNPNWEFRYSKNFKKSAIINGNFTD